MRGDLTRLIHLCFETWILLHHNLPTHDHKRPKCCKCKAAPPYFAAAAHTVEATVYSWKEVSTARLLCHIQCIILVWRWEGRVCGWEYYRDRLCVEIIWTGCETWPAQGCAPDQRYRQREEASEQATKGQEITYSSHSRCTTNQPSSAALSCLSAIDLPLVWCCIPSCRALHTPFW